MTRQVLSVAVACCLVVLPAVAVYAGANPDNGPGCGLGKLAWADYGGPKQIAPQVMMATTNGIFGSQTFGISSGTSGCTNDGLVMKNKHINMASSTFEDLAQEMAQGQGEHLASLATLLGVPKEDQPEFFALVQEQHKTLFPSGQATPLTMLQALQAAMAQHPVLAQVSFVSDATSTEMR
jgi:Protein of unknown function (DUF3015)